MAFSVYPDAAAAALLGKPAATPIALAPNEAMHSFVPLAGHVGPDPMQGGVPTCFIRIAVSGAPVGPGTHPKIELLAHDPAHGSPAPLLDPEAAVSVTTAVQLYDDVNATSAALVYFTPPFQNNVYLLKAAVEITGTQFWIRITNTGGVARSFVWVVADSDADSQQPWIHVTANNVAPARLALDVTVGQPAAAPLALTNFGTASVTVADITPALAAPFTIAGLPQHIAPNPSGPATVTVSVQSGAVSDFAPAVYNLVTSAKPDPGPFGAGHNNQFILSAHIHLPGSWATKAPMPTPRWAFGLAAASNGKLYAIGGAGNNADVLTTVEEYDPNTDTWTTKTPMPTARRMFGLVAANNGKLYAVGGEGSGLGAVAVVEEYNPATNSWASRAPMPTARWALGIAAAGNGKIYAVGGNIGMMPVEPPFARVEEYDPATNVWAAKQQIVKAGLGLKLAAAQNGKLYAVWGTDLSEGAQAATQEYDPATDSWTDRGVMPTPRGSFGLTSESSGRLLIVGGQVQHSNVTTVEEYDPLTNTWAARQPLATPRSSLQAAALNQKVYAIGGFVGAGNDTSASGLVEVYTP